MRAAILVVLLAATVLAGEPDVSALSAVSPSSISAALSKAPATVALSGADWNAVKGTFAESIVAKHLAESGSWRNATFDFGQGIDHLLVKLAPHKGPKIMVVESKFHSSELGDTASGKQMSNAWCTERFRKYGQTLASIEDGAVSGKLQLGHKPPGARYGRIPLRDGREVTVWRSSPKDSWRLDCGPEDLPAVRQQLRELRWTLSQASRGPKFYLRRVARVDFDPQGRIVIKWYDASNVGRGTTLKSMRFRLVEPTLSQSRQAAQFERAVREKLLQKGLSQSEASAMAKVGKRDYILWLRGRSGWRKFANSFGGSAAFGAAMGGAVTAVLAVPELVATGDWSMFGEMVAVGASAGLLGTVSSRATATLAAELGVKTTVARRLIGGTVGGAVAGAVFAYAGALLGWYDWETAHRVAAVSVVSAAVASLAASAAAGAGAGATFCPVVGTVAGIVVAVGIHYALGWYDGKERDALMEARIRAFKNAEDYIGLAHPHAAEGAQ